MNDDLFALPTPAILPDNGQYWTGGSRGELMIERCTNCGRLHHPSMVVCPDCPGAELEWVAVTPKATLIGYSVNHQMWHPALTPPYVIAMGALVDDPRIRITANLLDVDEADIRIQMPLGITFEQRGDAWLPQFVADPDGEDGDLPPLPSINVRPMASPNKFEDKVAITGVGTSAIGRRLMRAPVSLTVEACRAAVADAGLDLSDIDGVSTYPGGGLQGIGITEGGVTPVLDALGIEPTWHNGAMDTPGQAGSIMAAMLAVSSGLCRHVLCFRTVWEATLTHYQRNLLYPPPGGPLLGDFSYRIPYGAMSAANWIGMHASQYMHRFGVGRDVMGHIAVNARRNAALNDEAVYRDPMTIDDYFDARMISTPFGLFDCDVPLDGAVAVIVSAVDVAKDLAQPPVYVEAVGCQIGERISWDQGTVSHLPSVFGPGAHLWSRTDLTPADVDVAELYDGFSFNCVSWIEALGFCGVGEATDFVGDGSRIALDGDLPLNTHGGQLSAGRLHGYGFVREAVLQLRGQAGARQVPDAKVAAVSAGGGVPAGCFLFRGE